MIYKFFDKNAEGSVINIPLEFNEQLAKNLHKPIIRNFKKRRVYLEFKPNFKSGI